MKKVIQCGKCGCDREVSPQLASSIKHGRRNSVCKDCRGVKPKKEYKLPCPSCNTIRTLSQSNYSAIICKRNSGECKKCREAKHSEALVKGYKACSLCENEQPLDNFGKTKNVKSGIRSYCKSCEKAEREIYNTNNKELIQQRRSTPEARRKAFITTHKRRKKIKRIVTHHYSNGTMCCLHCGYDKLDALSIDHINDNGAEHRKNDPNAQHLSEYLYANDFPEGYQILCMNCQLIKKLEHTAKTMNERHNLTIRKTFKMSWNVQEALNKD